MNRGGRCGAIYQDKKDYQLFVDLLKETTVAWQMRLSAFCLMTNHYHLLVQTPRGNLSRCMRHLNGIYTQRFNQRYGFDGPLFRGRYKAIVVQADTHLLELVRYIHKNPARAKIVNGIGSYPWSSHKAYLSRAKKWDWLNKGFILNMLSGVQDQQVSAYRRFMRGTESERLLDSFSRRNLPSWIGDNGFIDWLKTSFYGKQSIQDIPQAKKLAPVTEQIIQTVCDYYEITAETLMLSRRGLFNEPRNMAIYLTRQLTVDSLHQISSRFNLNHYSSASSVVRRMERMAQKEPTINRRISDLKKTILGQE